MPVIITYKPLDDPKREPVKGAGRLVTHRCHDVHGTLHTQRFPLGSVGGVTYLDALCLLCGAHLVWVEEVEFDATTLTGEDPSRTRLTSA
ncbi:MAG: hypothetical protein N3C12_14490 [Candidatus Binatia bacterium]|nr:hypothetical protein [Candidatus Binatia bacterium]